MSNHLQKSETNSISKPERLFLIDALGALLSILLLSVVLVRLESVFGIPKATLYFLAFWPCIFMFYDLYCYFRIKHKVRFFLKGIAFANITYCLLSLATAFYHRSTITQIGWIYIILEITTVLILVKFEFRVANKH